MGSELSAGAAGSGTPALRRTGLRGRRTAPAGFDVGTAWSGGALVGSGDDIVIASLCSAKLFPILKLAPQPGSGGPGPAALARRSRAHTSGAQPVAQTACPA